jgi:ribosomal-protein-alanine N-acetyltransferase
MNHLVTPRLLMRPLAFGDLADLQALYSEPEVMKYIPPFRALNFEETNESLAKMISNFEESGYGEFAVFERKEKRFIGRCGLQPLENTMLIQLDYLLTPSAWGKGYATEVSMEILRSAFNDWGLEKIIAVCDERNTKSIKILKKIGMEFSVKDKTYDFEVMLYTITKQKKKLENIFYSAHQNSKAVVAGI